VYGLLYQSPSIPSTVTAKEKPPYIVSPNLIDTYMMVCFSCIYRLFKLFGAFPQPLEKYIFCEISPEHIFVSG